MRRIISIIFLLSVMLASTVSYGQFALPPVPDGRTCATVEQDLEKRLNDPQWHSIDELEPFIEQRIAEIRSGRTSGRTENTSITIPVIFHVIHNGEAVGTGTNLSAAQIAAQLEVLNEDFRRKLGSPGYNTHPDGADIEIEFCAALVDINGTNLTEPGVHRVRGTQSSWTRAQIEGELKPSTIWNPNFYYNIWTVRFAAEDADLLGYAQFPSGSGLLGLPESSGSATDGVVLTFSVVGSADKGSFPQLQAPYNRGRTLTHETGHWLGLRHIWGDGGCGVDDFCDDTPASDAPNRGCPFGAVSCGSNDMIENYMDYTDDACMNIFTRDQKARILAVLELSPRRGVLFQSQACGGGVSEPPVASFTSDTRETLLGGTVKFSDLSSNFPSSWTWTFEGGDPEVSNDRNPVVTYNSPGIFKVSLQVTNSIGSSDLLEIADYIFVSESGLCNVLDNAAGATPSLLRLEPVNGNKGFVAGHNSNGITAVSEYFSNELGYIELSAADINFGKAYTLNSAAKARIVVWNALGPQGAPGRILEEIEIPFQQIQQDISEDRATRVTFGRRVPLFLGTAFHIGVELTYNGDSLALITTANGESTIQSGWERAADGRWERYAIKEGLNIAHFIRPIVGMKPSVQVSASELLVYKSTEVTLNATGASIFSWSTLDGNVEGALGPQFNYIVREPTTFIVKGSGLDLCNDEARITVLIKESPLSVLENLSQVELYPNPVSGILKLNFELRNSALAEIALFDIAGGLINQLKPISSSGFYTTEVDMSSFAPGVYIIRISTGSEIKELKVIKR